MRFEVPQFIEIEDKIFGPFTWRQFVYLSGGAGLGVVLFFTAPFAIFILVGLPLGALAFLLAFYPVNNRPFSLFLEAMVGYFQRTRLYLWRKKGTGVYDRGDSEGIGDGFGGGVAAYTPPISGNLTTLSRRLELKAIQRER